MAAVNEVAPIPVALPALHQALRQAFATTFGIELVTAPVLPEEWQLARALYVEKYATPVWNLDGAAAWRACQPRHSSQPSTALR